MCTLKAGTSHRQRVDVTSGPCALAPVEVAAVHVLLEHADDRVDFLLDVVVEQLLVQRLVAVRRRLQQTRTIDNRTVLIGS